MCMPAVFYILRYQRAIAVCIVNRLLCGEPVCVVDRSKSLQHDHIIEEIGAVNLSTYRAIE
jgi:hypothetical protein